MKAEDLTNKRFGSLIVVCKSDIRGKDNRSQWLCKCDCGNSISVRPGTLKAGDAKSCGCKQGRERIDLKGQKFGRLEVIKEVGRDKHNKTLWECKCECGGVAKTTTNNLKSGNTQSCGCYNLEMVKENNFLDISNQRFGRLVVTKDNYSNGSYRKWRCVCDCGSEVFVSTGDLTSSHTKSCGCLQKEKASLSNYVDLAGSVFSRLTVIKEMPGKKNKRMWLCRCNCGAERILSTNTLNMGNTRSCGCILKEMVGKNAPNYKKTKSDEERIKGRYMIGGKNAENWRKEVFAKDEYTCKSCGQVGGTLNAHHLDGWNWCKEKRFDVNNGIALCEGCHKGFHKAFGKGNNTKEQFEEYLMASIK